MLGEREDRNALQVDLLPAREFEQQIEWPLEPIDVDDQALVVADFNIAFEIRVGHPGLPPSGERPSDSDRSLCRSDDGRKHPIERRRCIHRIEGDTRSTHGRARPLDAGQSRPSERG